MVKISGARAASARIRSFGSPEMEREVGAALFDAGQLMQAEAQLSITRGAAGGKRHTPSRPGEPPSADTHFLANNIETVQVETLRVEVSSNAPYSAALEFGTSKMIERPFMRPAAAKKRDEARQLVAKAVRKVAIGGRITRPGRIGD